MPTLLISALLLLAPDVDHEQRARDFLEQAQQPVEELAASDFETVFERCFDHARVGAFEVSVPFDAWSSKDGFEDVRDVLLALCEAQRRWLLLLAPDERAWSEAQEQFDADLERAARWVGSWRYGAFVEDLAGGRTARAQAEPDRRTAEALERLDLAISGGMFGLSGPVQLALALDRTLFLQTVSLAGWLEPHLKSAFWVDGVDQWSTAWINGVRLIALELDDPDRDEPERGLRLDRNNARATEQQVLHLALRTMCDTLYGDRLDGALASALGNLMVIEQFGEVDTRTDGDLGARRSDARSVFIPGAPSQGGFLPPARADSPWREEQGADWFVKPLQQSLEAGSGMVRERSLRHRTFRLALDALGLEQPVSGPFLGPNGLEPRLVPGLEGDWQEFTRSYRTCFVHWLRTEAGGRGKQSSARFAAFLAALGDPAQDESALGLVESVYGAPLSDAECSDGSLEGRFLVWLDRE